VTPLESRIFDIIHGFDGRVFVHIGPGILAPGTKNGFVVGKNELHLCFDPENEVHKSQLTEVPATSRVELIPTRIQEVALPAGSVDFFHAHNVFTRSQIGKDIEVVLGIVHRSLKTGGHLFASETITPREPLRMDLERLGRRIGFRRSYIIRPIKGEITAKERELLLRFVGFGRYRLSLMMPSSVGRGAFMIRLTKK